MFIILSPLAKGGGTPKTIRSCTNQTWFLISHFAEHMSSSPFLLITHEHLKVRFNFQTVALACVLCEMVLVMWERNLLKAELCPELQTCIHIANGRIL